MRSITRCNSRSMPRDFRSSQRAHARVTKQAGCFCVKEMPDNAERRHAARFAELPAGLVWRRHEGAQQKRLVVGLLLMARQLAVVNFLLMIAQTLKNLALLA